MAVRKSGVRTKGVALAIVAHPDDIEFCMGGTLLLLKNAGYEIHYHTVASGSCGSVTHSAAAIRKIRASESRAAARLLGAKYHPAQVDDLEIVYSVPLLRRMASLVRKVKPTVVLTHSPQDYMEDHTSCCRLAVTAAFSRGMPNFRTSPVKPPYTGEVTIYHAMPHGLRDGLRRRVVAGAYVNTTSVHAQKREALAAHESQKHWLDTSQGMDSYLKSMDQMSLELGRISRKFRHAEGWRRHSHIGFCAESADPLREDLGANYLVNRAYEKELG